MIPRRKGVRDLMLHQVEGERVRGHSVHVDCWLFPLFFFLLHSSCADSVTGFCIANELGRRRGRISSLRRTVRENCSRRCKEILSNIDIFEVHGP